jgi:cyclase
MATKRRLIATLVVRDGIVVQSIGFARYLPVGRPEIAARFLDDWGVDEIVLLDIGATHLRRLIPLDLVERVAEVCRVPLTVGGGIRTTADVRALLQAGADKVSINGAALERPALLGEAAEHYGVQCIVASIDARRGKDGAYRVFAGGGRRNSGRTPADLARAHAEAGAGEILLNAIHCDGMRAGYDLALVDEVAAAVDVPLIAMGGAGHPDHLSALFAETHASAAAVANMLHYSEHSVATLKSALRGDGLDLRLDSEADYRHMSLCPDARLDRRPEAELEAELFTYVQREVI